MDTSNSSYSEDSYAAEVEPLPGSLAYDTSEWPGAMHATTRSSVIMAPTKPAASRRGGGRKPKNDKLPPEEEEKRRVRRERNKMAAAKCRQRRVDHANVLLQETEKLEGEGRRLAEEIEQLRQLKEQYEFVVQSHRAVCKHGDGSASVRQTQSPAAAGRPPPAGAQLPPMTLLTAPSSQFPPSTKADRSAVTSNATHRRSNGPENGGSAARVAT